MGEPHGGRYSFARDVADGEGDFGAAVKEADEVAREMPGREHLRGELEGTATKSAWTAETTLHLSAFEHGVSEFISLSDCVGEFGLEDGGYAEPVPSKARDELLEPAGRRSAEDDFVGLAPFSQITPKYLADKFVANAVDGQDQMRFVWFALQLLAQADDVRIHRACGRKAVVAPDVLKKTIPAECFARMAHEIFQELKFLGGELKRLALP